MKQQLKDLLKKEFEEFIKSNNLQISEDINSGEIIHEFNHKELINDSNARDGIIQTAYRNLKQKIID